jgi:hypothetical protein
MNVRLQTGGTDYRPNSPPKNVQRFDVAKVHFIANVDRNPVEKSVASTTFGTVIAIHRTVHCQNILYMLQPNTHKHAAFHSLIVNTGTVAETIFIHIMNNES